MAIEKRRGCGYRKVGGLYLVGEGLGVTCGRLPYNVKICPVCGEGIRISRGYRWIDATRYFGGNCDQNCTCHNVGCNICFSDTLGKSLVMTVGKKFYTPSSFIRESNEMGVSKRISALPQGFVMGETWVLLVHSEAGVETVTDKHGQETTESCPAIFYAFKPTKAEKLLKESDATPEVVENYAKRGITVVKVPDNDQDHQGNVYDDLKREKAEQKENRTIGDFQ